MKVDKIKVLKNGKYRLTFDNDEKITTYDDVILINHLLYSKTIDIDQLNKIQIDTSYYDIYYKVLKFINIKMRSTKELIIYLTKLGASECEQTKILDQLKKIGLINDTNYAKAYTFDKIHLTSSGPYKIREELLQLEIDEGIVDEIIESIPNDEIITKLKNLIEKKIKVNKKHSLYMFKQKLIIDFCNLGYDRTDIISILESITISDDDQLINEFDKLYKKLSNKISGVELCFKIKQKLCAKGFDINDVSRIINEKIEIN